MSISRLPRSRAGKAEREPDTAPYAMPVTVSRPELLDAGADRRFRALVSDLFTLSARMEQVREHLGRRMGLSGPQYSLLVAVAHLQGARGISVGTLAQALHVSSAFVASETGKLARRGLLIKRTNPLDRRGVLLTVAPAARLKIDRVSAEMRAVNDLFFGALDGAAFRALSGAAAALVESSAGAMRYLDAVKGSPQAALPRTG
jgi:DNA-binding MarR family transcriptional regulator